MTKSEIKENRKNHRKERDKLKQSKNWRKKTKTAMCRLLSITMSIAVLLRLIESIFKCDLGSYLWFDLAQSLAVPYVLFITDR